MLRTRLSNRLRRVSANANVPAQPLHSISATTLEPSRKFLLPRPLSMLLPPYVTSPGQTPMHAAQYSRLQRLHRAAVQHHAADVMSQPHS